jgi:nitric oxide dioxygenase
VSVKRESGMDVAPAGQVSNWIHANVKEGSVLQVSHPFGDFTPDTESNEPVVLLSAGVGVTPMIGALNRIAKVHPQRHVIFGFAARDAAHHPHQADLAAAKAAMPNLQVVTFYENVGDSLDAKAGRMAASQLPSWPRTEANVYMCGPLPFMQEQWQGLVAAGVPPARLHREVFGPDMLDHLL